MNQDYLASSTETVCSRPVDAMTNLSPAAQAVLDAYVDEDRAGRLAVAAALRAAADQLVPKTPTLSYPEDYELGVWVANDDTRTGILAIAAELEGDQ